ncbi:related to homocysteine S-methyltransferase [Melanopsichium pennsylvanicum]|uniref:Related to homocysteine S-methyltransferase n=2 Tax=Melanopsichium pennsylvanicum TaxID=63383 RepID=A0AAJ4XJR6_9BASI|nr:related to homocysteine S-methyltransferase [Melanopsichium pennsylvanicum 4]SNX83081.1 related to homocysteine S-methyltransferase [Melanopsichium pennsylvanicum]
MNGSIDQSALESLLDSSRIGILDGGLATYLEDGLNFDLSKGPLWSARLLDQKQEDVSNGKGQKGIFDAHLHYLQAGAGIIGTATYQASQESFARANYHPASASYLMSKAVDLACEALHTYNNTQSSSPLPRPLISLSLGPYGGMLSNGAEYTGDYRPTFLPETDSQREQQPSLEEMTAFHQRRIEAFVAQPSWKDVGVLAVETVPRADEALAFRLALENVVKKHQAQGKPLERKPVYISMAFPDDKRLPWPPLSTIFASEDDDDVDMDQDDDEADQADSEGAIQEEMNWLVQIVVDTQVQAQDSLWPIAGIGINCTKPYLLPKLVERMSNSLLTLNMPISEGGMDLARRRAQAGQQKPLLCLYPDGGLIYEPVRKVWLTPSNAGALGGDSSAASWASNLMKLAKSITASSANVWSGVFVGGCCKSGTDEIRALCQCRSA